MPMPRWCRILLLCIRVAAQFRNNEDHNVEPRYPLGIELGPEFIWVAYFKRTDDLQFEVLRPISGNAQYIDFMRDSERNIERTEKAKTWFEGQWMNQDETGLLVPVPPFHYDIVLADKLFNMAIEAIEAKIKPVPLPGRIFEIGSVTYPNTFNLSCQETIHDAVKRYVGLEKKEIPWRFIEKLNAVRLAYDLDTCEAFGVSGLDCYSQGHWVPQEIVLVERNRNSLSFTYGRVLSSDFIDSDYYVRIDNINSEEPLLTESDGIWQKRKVFQRHLRPADDRYHQYYDAFLGFMQARFIEEKDGTTHFCRKLKAVLFSGEAELWEFNQVRDFVKAVIPSEHHLKIRESIHPNYVGSIGAAIRAMSLAQRPLVRVTTIEGGVTSTYHARSRPTIHDEL